MDAFELVSQIKKEKKKRNLSIHQHTKSATFWPKLVPSLGGSKRKLPQARALFQ